jgi:ribosomal protein L21E
MKSQILTIAVAALATVALAAAPAIAKEKESKKKSSGMHHSSAAAAASSTGHIPEIGQAPKRGEHDTKPGPAWKTVGGTVKQIDGNAYTVEDYEGNQVKLYVGQGTKHIKQKKVGDTVRAEITRGGFANSVQ